MSRTRKSTARRLRSVAHSDAFAPQISASTGQVFGGTSGISAGEASPDRGYVYFPSLRAKYHFTRAPRKEVIKKSRWLTYNDGNGRLLRHLADWIGPVSVEPSTSDSAWNVEMKQLWEELYVDSVGYDGSGKMTSETYQSMLHFMADRDGDVLNVWAQQDTGEPTVCLYDGISIDDHFPTRGNRAGEWLDGVKVGAMNRHQAYLLQQGDRFNIDPVEISARDALMLAHYETPEAVRGTPVTIHAVDNMLDTREIDRDIKRAIKIRGLFGLAIESDAATGPVMKPIGGKLVAVNAPAALPDGTDSDTLEVPRYREQVFDSGGVVHLPGGKSIKAVADEREAPSQEAIKNDIYANIARGLGVRVQFLFLLEKLTGPGIRMVLSDVQQWRERRLKRMIPFVRMDYARRVEWLIRTRQIRAPRDPQPFRCSYTFPKSLTIDAGRDNAGRISALKSGLTNLRREFGEEGDQWLPETKQRLGEIDEILNQAAVLSRGDKAREAQIVSLYFSGVPTIGTVPVPDDDMPEKEEELADEDKK